MISIGNESNKEGKRLKKNKPEYLRHTGFLISIFSAPAWLMIISDHTVHPSENDGNASVLHAVSYRKSNNKDSTMLKYLLIVVILFSCKVDWKAMPYGHMNHHWSLYSQSDTMVIHQCDKYITSDIRCPAKDTFYFRRY